MQLQSITMTRRIVGLTVLLFFVAPATCAADAAGNLPVSATIAASCRVNSGARNFNTYDPSGVNASTPLQRSGSFRVTCANTTPATVKLSQGNNPAGGSGDASPLRKMEGDPGIYLRYDLNQDAGRNTVWGNTAGSGKAITGTGSQNTVTVYGRARLFLGNLQRQPCAACDLLRKFDDQRRK